LHAGTSKHNGTIIGDRFYLGGDKNSENSTGTLTVYSNHQISNTN
jgi:hypothetical protein